jgi:hypothetical protein
MFMRPTSRLAYLWRIAILLLALCWCTHISVAQSTEIRTPETSRAWRFGAFLNWGGPPHYVIANSNIPVSAKLKLGIISAGFEAGRLLGARHGAGILRGQAEGRLEIAPLWIGRYPSQVVLVLAPDGSRSSVAWEGQNFFGVSATPALVRWNFSGEPSKRLIPWLQMGGGLLWTNHKFPLTMWAAPASAINFTPQIGGGFTFFGRGRQSVDIGVKIVHISNAGLGDSNPGLNQTIQGVVSYSLSK